MTVSTPFSAINQAPDSPVGAPPFAEPDLASAPALAVDSDWADEMSDPAAAQSALADWIAPALAGLMVAAWTGLFAWAMPAGATPAQWAGLAAQWSGPVVVIGMGYVVSMRFSRREAGRFADAARLLRAESQLLEERLTSVNREISLARDFLAAQTRDIESMGRVAVERISQHSGRLAELVQDNSARVETLGSVSSAALGNMEQLRDHLPVIATAAKDVTSNIGNAGRVAHAHLQDMVKGLNRLNEFGQASERQVASLRDRIEATLTALETRTQHLDRVITGRFEALEERSTGFALDLERHESDARESLRQRAAVLGDEIAATRSRLDRDEADALTSLRARLSALRDEAATISRALREGETGALAEWQSSIIRLSGDMTHFDNEVNGRHATAIDHAGRLGAMTEATTLRLAQAEARIEALTIADNAVASGMETRLETLQRRLSETDSALEKLTDSSVRLLELIQSSARQAREDLPVALTAGEAQLVSYEERVTLLRDTVEAARDTGLALSGQVSTAQDILIATTNELGALHDGVDARMAAHATTLGTLREGLNAVEQDTTRLADHAQGELDHAISALTDAVRSAVHVIEVDGAARVSSLAEQLSNQSGAALERAMRLKGSEISGQLEQAAAHATGVSREAAQQLRDQLAAVEELAVNLERRIAEARDRAEEQVDSDFTRRMAVITDTLNSSAVDITRALNEDVADTAWAAYLRGDRGIFSRRAVKLLDAGDARQVLQLYENDSAFQAHVNRYIHDFEGMLRHLLATRDGHAISVTLLSSDMGKLYVALAQAIERLRT